MNTAHLSPRFCEAVVSHLGAAVATARHGGAQLLLILGPPGAGKSFQVNELLRSLGIEIVSFKAADSESPSSNIPVVALQQLLYQVSSENVQQFRSVVLIDDADLVLGRQGNTQYTHNLQKLNVVLMAAAESANADGPRVGAAPIIFCVNNPNVLHSPLIRHGRARLFHWEPTTDELVLIVGGIFPSLVEHEVRKLIALFPEEYPAFYGQIRDSLVELHFRSLYRTQGSKAVLERASMMALLESTAASSFESTMSDLASVGRMLRAERSNLRSYVDPQLGVEL